MNTEFILAGTYHNTQTTGSFCEAFDILKTSVIWLGFFRNSTDGAMLVCQLVFLNSTLLVLYFAEQSNRA